jgi:hypothetical protein
MQRREFLSKIARAGVAASSTATTFSLAPAAEGKPRIRIGQIGTGHAHADGKLAAILRSPNFELAGVVEPDERLRRAAATRKDYKDVHWLTEEQLLNTPGLRAVAVETEVKDLLAVGGRCVTLMCRASRSERPSQLF